MNAAVSARAPLQTTPAVKAAVHILAASGGDMLASDLAQRLGMPEVAIRAVVANARLVLLHIRARISSSFSTETLTYRLEGAGPAEVAALLGPYEPLDAFMGLTGLRAQCLRVIVERGEDPITLRALCMILFGNCYENSKRLTSNLIAEIRASTARQGSSKTVVNVGAPNQALFLWREPVAVAQAPAAQDEAEARQDYSITLPSVAGSYRYAAGRLLLNGQPVEVRT